MNDSQTERFDPTFRVLERDEVPAGSFRYGQFVNEGDFAVAPHLFAVCTWASKPKNEADNGASGFDQVLVAQFLHTSWERACDTVRSLSRDGMSCVLVKPQA
jgi:hypothetical protein